MLQLNWTLSFKANPDISQVAIISEAPQALAEERDRLQSSNMLLSSGSSADVAFGTITAGQSILMVADRPVKVALSGSLTPFQAQYLLLDGGDITSIALTNLQSNPADIRIYVLGS